MQTAAATPLFRFGGALRTGVRGQTLQDGWSTTAALPIGFDPRTRDPAELSWLRRCAVRAQKPSQASTGPFGKGTRNHFSNMKNSASGTATPMASAFSGFSRPITTMNSSMNVAAAR